MNLSVDLTLPGPGAEEVSRTVDATDTDLLAGVRLVGAFNERWTYRARFDYAGGGSEGAVNVLGTIGYSFGQSDTFRLEFGYRHFSMKFNNAANTGLDTETDVTLSGPLLGAVFNF
jgi:hypothetical protein